MKRRELRGIYTDDGRTGSRIDGRRGSKRRSRKLMKLGKPRKRRGTRSRHHQTSTTTGADITVTTAKMYPFSNLRPNSLWPMALHHRSPHTILNTPTLQQPAWNRYTGQWLLLRLLRDTTISIISSTSTILCLPSGAPSIVSRALTVLNSQLQRNR